MKTNIFNLIDRETRKDNLKLLAIENAEKLNNFLDDDCLAEAINQTKAAKTDQEFYEAINYAIASIELRKGEKTLLSDLLRKYAELYADEMSLLDHIRNRNGEAIARTDAKRRAGKIVRLI